MERRGVPVRIRLAGWYTLVLLTVMVVVGAVIYFEVQEGLTESLEADLEDRSDLLLNLVSFDSSGKPSLELPTNDRRFSDSFQRLLDANALPIIDNSAVYGEIPLETDELADAREDRREWSNVEVIGPDTRLLTTAIENNGRFAGYLQVGGSREEIDETLDTILVVLGLAAPLAAITCGLVGWWLSARAFQPVNEITSRARSIADGDLKSRLNLKLPDDEVGRLAATFDAMIGRLDEMWTRQRRFTADASHELRTPLAGLRGQVEVALSQPRTNEEYRETLGSLNRQVQRMTRLVEGLLLVARSEAGAIPLEKEQVDVSELVHSVEEQVAPMAAAKGLRLAVAEGFPTHVYGDEALLLQLLLNLSENAVHYTNEGEIILSWLAMDGRVELRVSDSGPGIAPEHLQRIFEPFYRVDASRSNGSGAGLGLAICQWIVEAHGGTLSVTSSDAGTTFIASLPNASVTATG